MKVIFSANLFAAILYVLAKCTAVRSLTLGGRLFNAGERKVEDKFVTDPSANVTGVFKKEGDMTFIMHSDPLSDDFEEDEDRRRKRNAVLNARSLWPGAIVPYEISSFFNEQERRVIFSAMKHWEDKTCIRFRPKQSTDVYSIFIMSGPVGVCQSFVGRISSSYQPQGVTLGQYCVWFPTIVHELGHAIGFYHEHNRPDRDEHIQVRFNNVQPQLRSAFNKVLPGRTNLLGYGYDYASIMHYSRDAFSDNGQDTIVARDSSIPFGDAGELSPLDIAKANALYNCGPESGWPPPRIVVPVDNLSLPTGISCGAVSNGQTTGTFRSPGFPSYRHNLDCAYVIKVPKGYTIQFQLNRFAIEQNTRCTKDYVRVYYGTTLNSNNIVRFSGTTEGRICDDRGYTLTYRIFTDLITVYFHTDGSGSGSRGLDISFNAMDVNECRSDGNNCHRCNNLPGGYECVCRDGYYHSAAATTCYDVNECAYSNGGCQHKCVNSGGSYRCECNSGYFLQANNKSCATTPPTKTPPTTMPPTTPPPAAKCGRNFTTSSGIFQTPNWPQTYPTDLICEWFIQLPDARKLVEISCDDNSYGIAGAYPDCPKDYLTFYDGHSSQDTAHGPYCQFTKPGTLTMSSNLAKVYFFAGPSHNPSRVGFKCSFRSVDGPTTPPPPSTTPPPPSTTPPPLPSTTPLSLQCGGLLNAASGSFQTPNWPETYPVNIDCEWRIQLPDSNMLVEISCDEGPFGIAGALPLCPKDYLKMYDGHSKADTEFGPFCYFTKPETMQMSSNKAMAIFHAGPSHSSSRKGFKCSYRSVNPPTTRAPTTSPPTQPSGCNELLTAASGSLQSENWPQTYPVNVDCTWTIVLPDSTKRVEFTFASPFGIAGSLPVCVKDQLYIFDDNTGTRYGPYCYFTVPNPPVMTSNRARVVLHAGPAHNPSRRGFKATYRSV